MKAQRKSRAKALMVNCEEHPLRSRGAKPDDGCLLCEVNYNRSLSTRRKTYKAKGTVMGLVNGRGKCGVCGHENSRLSGFKLSNGLDKCEGCQNWFDSVDGIAGSVKFIRRDMSGVGVPLNRELNGGND